MLNEAELRKWSQSPASEKSINTHTEIRQVLDHSEILRGKEIGVYLQGSYANHTNIRVDSDVDVVAQLASTFNFNISKLSESSQIRFRQVYPRATYQFVHFHRDVFVVLRHYFGESRVRLGNKSIKIKGDANHIDADVVPCLQFRKYHSFTSENECNFSEGMFFSDFSAEPPREIVNFPKLHRENGQDKNAGRRTDGMYKNVVRVLKNVKRHLVDNNILDKDVAPSYFIECVVYNVPDECFVKNSLQDSLFNAVNFVLRHCSPDNLLVVSEQHKLFGAEPWQWNQPNATEFFRAINQFLSR